MRVLVTRPKVSAARTIERLKNMGHEPVALPLSEPVHNPQAAIAALRHPHSALAITSAEAVRVLATSKVRLHLDTDIPIYTVGQATAEAASGLGFRSIASGKGTGQNLADLIADTATERDFPILYLAGNPRSPDFEARLKGRGIAIRIEEIYGMHPVDYPTTELSARLNGSSIDAVLLYSQETALRFFTLVAPIADALANTRILCISERTAGAVPENLHHNVVIAQSPDEDALLALL